MKTVRSVHGQMSDRFHTALFIILSGGFQDAYTYTCRSKVFANAQTGNVILMSTALFQRQWGDVIKYLIPLISFIFGIAVAECAQMHLKHYKKIHWRQLILIGEILLLFLVGFLPSELDFLANALVSFVCAMQVQAFSKLHGNAYASTMCIGNLRSGTVALCTYFRVKDKKILKKSLTYFSVIGTFAVGAALGSLVSPNLGYPSIWICCVLLFISFIIMFVPEEK
jgi:uncharacterized membrane protein YoaK (UPF0700 family)